MDTIEKFLVEFEIKNKPVLIGFSAGPDSVYLTHQINKLKEKYNLDLILCYFNHGWRKEADDEEIFTINFAKKIKAQYYIEKAPKNSKKTEETARNLRYAFFEKAAKKFKTDVVLLAHNKNDNIETLLYRTIKGTSTKGLTSIPKQRDIYYRPILDIAKNEILKKLQDEKITFMIDSSNDDIKYQRNLIRKELFPTLKKINPNFIENIDILIKNAINSKEIINSTLSNIKKEIMFDNEIIFDKFISYPESFRLEILNDYLKDELKYRDYKTIKKLDDCILKNKKRSSISKEKYLSIKNNRIFIEIKKSKNEDEIIINSIGEYKFNDTNIKIEKVKSPKFFKKPLHFCYIKEDFPFVLRHRKEGDLFQAIGHKKTDKLKNYLISQKIRQDKKDELLLLCKEKTACLIFDVEINENYKISNDEKCLKISWEKL